MPLVSVCVPTYNGGTFLEDCLQSVCEQTFRDIEILIVDDGSDDSTVEIVRRFARNDERIRLRQNGSRLGLAGNWNRCVELARGEWIKFVFQDDLLTPECISLMLRKAESSAARFLCCRRDFIFDAGVAQDLRDFYLSSAIEIDRFYAGRNSMAPANFAEGVVTRFRSNMVGEPTATLLHKSVFAECGPFETNLIMCCDYEFWNRAGSRFGVTYLAEALAIFRVHGRSASSHNAASRRIRMTRLDWFIMLHDVLYHPRCEKLRAAGARRFGIPHLRRLCCMQAWRAQQAIRHEKALNSTDAHFLQEEWATVLRSYPRLPRMAEEGWLSVQVSRFGKVFSWGAWKALLKRRRTA